MDNTAKLIRIPRTRTPYGWETDLDSQQVIYEGSCSVQPFLGIEDEINRDTITSQCRLISDDTGFYVATALDYIEYNGELWKIDGKPFIWRLITTHHIEITMRLVEG
jgi:hypothetical protein